MSRMTMNRQQGFTLLEMMIAVTLVAMMAVGLWGVFRVAIGGWSRGTQMIDANQRHRSIMDLVKKQMAATYWAAPTDGERQEQQAEIPPVLFEGTDTGVRFVSLNALDFQEHPGLTLVSYSVAQDGIGNYSLVESEQKYLGSGSAQETSSAAEPTVIFENLSGCTFQYFDPQEDDNAGRWVDQWSGEESRRLPTAISLSLTSRDSKGNASSRHMVIPIKAEPDARSGFDGIRIGGRRGDRFGRREDEFRRDGSRRRDGFPRREAFPRREGLQ